MPFHPCPLSRRLPSAARPRRGIARVRAGLSEPRGHHHRAVSGGRTDRSAGAQLAPKFSEKLGQNFIVENVSGGATTIATGRVARATPDGHTLLLHNLQISANVALHPNLPFDTEKDLAPVAFVNHNPLVLVGRKSLAPNTLGELIAWMRTTPAKMAHPGTGSTGHLTTSLFAQEAKATVDHIPYRGAAPALQDIIGDHVDLFFATPQSVLQAVKAGQMKAYGITAKETVRRSSRTSRAWCRSWAPSSRFPIGTRCSRRPARRRPIVDKLNAVLQGVMDDPAIVKAWADTGVAPYPKDQRSPRCRAGAAAQRDCALGPGGARQQHPAGGTVTGRQSSVIRNDLLA